MKQFSWIAAIVGGLVPVLAAGLPRNQCFPVETLSVTDRETAEKLLLQALDSDALFTIVTGLKPMTTAYAQRFSPASNSGLATHFRISPGDLKQLPQLQSINSALSCGDEITADAVVMPGSQSNDGRVVWPYISNRPALRRVLAKYQDLYKRYWISEYTPPTAVLMLIGVTPRPNPDVERMFGHLFGYPDYAVEWYVEHGQPKSPSGEPLFGFVTVPAFENGTAFSWTTEKDHMDNDADKELRRRAGAILTEYKKRRAAYIGTGKPGVAALIRDWLDDGHGRCAAENAQVLQ